MTDVVIPLAGGVDEATPSTLKPRGTLISCNNMEVDVGVDGYKVCDGFSKYDGLKGETYTELVFDLSATIDWQPSPGIWAAGANFFFLCSDSQGTFRIPFRIVSVTSDPWIIDGPNPGTLACRIVVNAYVTPDNVLRRIPEDNRMEPVFTNFTGFTAIVAPDPDNAAYVPYTKTLTNAYYTMTSEEYNIALASVLQSISLNYTGANDVPGTGRVTGMFHRKGKVYAVRDCVAINFTNGLVEPVDNSTLTFSGGLVANVVKVVTTSGVWAASGGNAAGYCLIRLPNSDPFAEVGSQVVTQGATSMFTYTTERTTDRAGLVYVESENGWTWVEPCREVLFRDGGGSSTSQQFRYLNRAVDLETIQQDPVETPVLVPDSQTNEGGWSVTNISKLATVDATYAKWSAATVVTPTISNFLNVAYNTSGVGIPSNASIAGFELAFTRGVLGSGNYTFQEHSIVIQDSAGNTISFDRAQRGVDLPTSQTTRIIGGLGDVWGGQLTPANMADFKIRVQVAKTGGSDSGRDVYIDAMRCRIWYRDATSRIYFYDTVGAIDVVDGGRSVHYVVQKGDITNSTPSASGILTVTGLENYGVIRDGLQIRSGESGSGSLLAIAASRDQYVLLPSAADMDAAASQYVGIDEGFYSNDNRGAYVATGASPLVYADDELLFYARSPVEQSVDKPRHVARHYDQLAIAIGQELLFASVPVPEENITELVFNASAGALALSCGTTIRGLLSLQNGNLAIFGERGVRRIPGPSDSALVDIDPVTSCIEYSVQDFASGPMWLDNAGLQTLETTDQYGDFIGRRLSRAVTKRLLFRLQQDTNTRLASQRFVSSVVIRKKGQYRAFFADGFVMTFTLTADGPATTFAKYEQDKSAVSGHYSDFGPEYYYQAAQCISFVDTHGRDRAFATWRTRQVGGVFELDNGVTFGGDAFNFSIDVGPLYLAGIEGTTSVTQVQVHGMAFGYGSLMANTSVNSVGMTANQELFDFGLRSTLNNDLQNMAYGRAGISGSGRSVTIRLGGRVAEEQPVGGAFASLQRPSVLQTLVVTHQAQSTANKSLRGD